MNNCIKTEFYKVFHRKAFYIALTIGIALSIMDSVQNFIDVQGFPGPERSPGGYEGISLYLNWIGINGYTLGHKLILHLWPLIAAIPFGDSYLLETKSGYANQIVVRVGRKKYLVSKLIANFVAGGLVLFVTVFINLITNALICPVCTPTVIVSILSITNKCFLSTLFYTHPLAFTIIWCGIVFLWGGVTATLCLAVSRLFKHPAAGIVFPFAFYIVVTLLLGEICSIFDIHCELSPLYLFNAAPDSANPAYVLFTEMAAIFVVSSIVFLLQDKRHENI